MNNQNMHKLLHDIGLSANETNVYLAALSLNSASILDIARKANMKRTTVYGAIESLQSKGLMNSETRGLKQKFRAENPENLQTLLEQKSHELARHLPELLSLYQFKGDESFIRYYQGIEGIKNVYRKILREVKTHSDYYVISNSQGWYDTDPEFFQKFLEKRAKMNMNLRLLVIDNERGKYLQQYQKNFNQTVKLLPKDINLEINTVILPHKVVFHIFGAKPLAIVIENSVVIQMQKQLFEMLWNFLPENHMKNLSKK